MENIEREKRFVILGKASNGGGGGGEGTVTSVGISVPTGLNVTGSPVTSSGTIQIGFANGYSIPTTAKQSEWDAKSDFSGDYNDLTNKPTIPSKTSDLTNDSGFISQIKTINNESLIGTGNITVSTFSGDYNDLTNKPTIPTVGNGTITITQGGVTKGTFTLNQSGNSTITLDAGGSGGGDVTADGDNTFTGTNTFSGETVFDGITTMSDIIIQNIEFEGNSINTEGVYLSNEDEGVETTLSAGRLSMNAMGGGSSLVLSVSVETDENDETISVADIIADMTNLRISAGSVTINDADVLTINDVTNVATTGSYDDLSDKPTIPSKTSDLTNDSGFISQIKTINNQSMVGTGNITVSTFSGSYNDLTNKPSMSTETLTFIDDNNVSTTVVVYTQPTV